MIDWQIPIVLSGTRVELRPLESNHQEELLMAASDGKLWGLWYTSVPSEKTVTRYVETALMELREQRSLPFIVVHKETGKIIGSTRYCHIDEPNRRLEIGYTWYAKSYQRTGVNTECKYLLLKQAFEQYQTIAVEFKTNWFNFKSREAILRLGAKQDGVLRNHRINSDGSFRDSVVFSIIQSEWGSVRRSLEHKMK
ncbi:MAG: GNAT family protein [Bacteroidota bacterium]